MIKIGEHEYMNPEEIKTKAIMYREADDNPGDLKAYEVGVLLTQYELLLEEAQKLQEL